MEEGDFRKKEKSRHAAIIAPGGLSVLRGGDFRGGLPQPVELVKFPDAIQENVHHEIAVVDQDPPPLAGAFHAQRSMAFLLQRFLDMTCQGGDLPVGGSRAEEKIIGEGGVFPDVQGADLRSLFLLREPRTPDHRIPCGYGRPSSLAPRYSPCSAMYSSTSGGTRPRMHCPPRTFSRMEREEISRAGMEGQYNLRPSGRR